MRSFELFIVFAALIVMVALAAIAIDWVGRPLKNKRFIPRIYRFDDELAYGEAQQLGAGHDAVAAVAAPPRVVTSLPPPGVAMPSMPLAPPVMAGPPVVVTPPAAMRQPSGPAVMTPPLAPPAPPAPAAPDLGDEPGSRPDRSAPSKPGRPTVVATVAASVQADTPASTSAFSDQVGDDDTRDDADPAQSRIARTVPEAAPALWTPGDPLDAREGERKPTTAIKAQRYWRTVASGLEIDSHFDDASRSRMADGRAPRRRNPRTGATETAALVGLRAASSADEVRMYWPDDSVDPWSGS